MRLVFLLEERSMEAFLDELLPRILPKGVEFRLIPHEGKSDLEKSIPRKLRRWREPDVRFVIVRDQDNGDCHAIKKALATLCTKAGKPATLIRIACRELEAWFLGDLRGVAKAFDQPKLAKLQTRRKYRTPDTTHKPSRELTKLVKGYGKTAGARKMGSTINLLTSSSPSFLAFVSGVKKLIHRRS
jgi:hypothetical protein